MESSKILHATLKPLIRSMLQNVLLFAEYGTGTRLRYYQEEVALAIVNSIIKRQGLTFVVIYPRQSGKNELQAQIEAYLLSLFCTLDAEIVKVSPTWKPQSLNAMRRLERVLERCLVTGDTDPGWSKESGYIYRVGGARIYFLSGQPSANIVGATASTLLQCDEAQDVLVSKWDKEISPMAASTNATRVFWGTAWTSTTLLAREKRAALESEKLDGLKRVFHIDANRVTEELPEYGVFVESEIAKLGRNHPFIKTQYFSQEIESESGMFPPVRQALMQGDHPPLDAPEPGSLYAFLIDVAGEDEGAMHIQDALQLSFDFLTNPARDSTALTIVEIDLATLSDDLIAAPTYFVRQRALWTGVRHTMLYARIKALVELWEPRYMVIDATGVGAGISSFFANAYPSKVLPYTFNAATKSKLGWDFLAVIETGRFKDHIRAEAGAYPDQEAFWLQVRHVQMEIAPGPNRRMKWSVPESARDPSTGELVHDDLLISAALCAQLDECTWGTTESAIILPVDPLVGLPEVF